MKVVKEFAPTRIEIDTEEDLEMLRSILYDFVRQSQMCLRGVSLTYMRKEDPRIVVAETLYEKLKK